MAGRRVIKGRRWSDVAAVTLLARCFLLLVGAVIYHQHGQDEHYQEKLRAACAAKGGKLALSNLCINMKPILDDLTARYRLRRRSHIVTITWSILQ